MENKIKNCVDEWYAKADNDIWDCDIEILEESLTKLFNSELEKERQRIKDKCDLIEDLLDDCKEKVAYHVNISEHSGEIRKLLNEIRGRKRIIAEIDSHSPREQTKETDFSKFSSLTQSAPEDTNNQEKKE